MSNQCSEILTQFSRQVLSFLTDIFSFQSADFNSVSSLSESGVMVLARSRLTVVRERLGCLESGIS